MVFEITISRSRNHLESLESFFSCFTHKLQLFCCNMPSSVLNYYHTINFSIANYMEKEEDAAEYFSAASQISMKTKNLFSILLEHLMSVADLKNSVLQRLFSMTTLTSVNGSVASYFPLKRIMKLRFRLSAIVS